MTHYVSYLNLEGEVSSCKMNRFIGNFSLNWKWAWQAQFLSYWPITLENWISFRDVQMILVPFFKILNGYRVAKNVRKLHVQVIPRSRDCITSKTQKNCCARHFRNLTVTLICKLCATRTGLSSLWIVNFIGRELLLERS